MRILLTSLALLISIISFSQTIGVRSLEPTKKEVNLPCYDTSSVYLDLSKLSENIHYYDNQPILISPNTGDKVSYTHYKCFLVKDSIEMHNHPDTVWLKKRKKVKPGDFYVTYPKTLTYKPDYVENGVVRTIGENSYPTYAFERLTGFYTPSEYIDGKTFTIIGVSKLESSSVESKYCFHLIDSDGFKVDFYCTKSFRYYEKEEYFPSILMVSYIDKYRTMYVDKVFHAKDVSKYSSTVYLFQDIASEKYFTADGDLTCVDLSLIRGKSSLAKLDDDYQPIYGTDIRLFFKDKEGNEFCIPIESKYNYSLSLSKSEYEDYTYGKMYYQIQLDNMILASDYYAQKEAERIAEENRIAEEQRQKAERKARLTKKYGKTYADLILQGKVRIGMTAEMCREAWGVPDDINRSSGSWGVHEQWCYDWGGYLYMENGKLTSIQN